MARSPLRVLLIEDSNDDVLLLVRELRKGGFEVNYHQVETAADMQAALDQRVWDVVISDYVLPDFTAPQALQILHASGIDLPFIVVSRVVGEDAAVDMMRAGAHDYLLKGQLKRLVPAIDRELREAEVRRGKQQAEAALHRAFDELEQLVQQRTAELERVNQELKVEIEERTQAERGLAQLAAIVRSSNDAIVSATLDGYVLSWNPGAERLYGYSAEEAKGQLLSYLIQPDPSLKRQIFGDHRPVTTDYHQTIHKRKDGELLDVFMTISPIQDATDEIIGISMIAADISDRRSVERIKDELISIISHELRTPITSLQASIQLLMTGRLGELTDKGQRMLEVAANNMDRLVQLINNFLDLERLTSGQLRMHKQLCDIATLVNQTVTNVEEIANKAGVELLVDVLPLQVLVDPKQIIQALTHLISNAIKFSEAGRTVQIATELKYQNLAPERPVKLGVRSTQEELERGGEMGHRLQTEYMRGKSPATVLITVKDEGAGIPSNSLESIFEHLYQGNASDTRHKGGVGLGLAICRSIIRQHQGDLWVESVLGKGSTFYVALPIEPEESGLVDLIRLRH